MQFPSHLSQIPWAALRLKVKILLKRNAFDALRI